MSWFGLLLRGACVVLLMTGWPVPAATESLLWFDGVRPGLRASQAVELLLDAGSEGLDPLDYSAAALALAVDLARNAAPLDAAAAAELDHALTRAMEHYLADLHRGRIAPEDLPHGYPVAGRAAFYPEWELQTALASGQLTQAVRNSAPRISQYRQLRDALAYYRTLVNHPAWQVTLPPLPAGPHGSPPKLEPGQPYAGNAVLRDRLIALGDLPSYEGALIEGVRSFQLRHGLTADGVIGKATFAQLNVSPVARARQIELTMERLRWTPLLEGPRMVVINIPEFVLRAYEVDGDTIAVRATMKVIIGKALDTRTPIFEEQMRSIEFQPFWNVPPSIARGEVVPRLRRDPGYFDREGFEFVSGSGGVISTLSPSLLVDVLAGQARIRQRPGPRNALGDTKFVFPNRDNIYLHHTPSVRLFERDRRDFSHGCIRVEKPLELAVFALQGMPEWNEERIRRAMTESEPSSVRLVQPIPVVIAYGTAIFKQGRIHFFDDIYGHDRRLDAALRDRRTQPLTSQLRQ